MLEVSLRRQMDAFALSVDLCADGGVTALFGPSGAGKTTVARCIAGLETPDSGRIVVDGRTLFGPGVNVPVHRRGIGYVFQEARLFPHLTVRGNLLYGAPSGTCPDEVVDMLGIGPLMARRPGRLSGGEAARVAIGRALLRSPRLLILDEPLAALDQRRRAAILPYLERVRDAGVPILYISHAIEEVARLASTLVMLRDGQLRHAGPVQDLLCDPVVAEELGPSQAGAVITGRIQRVADGLAAVASPLGVLQIAGLDAGEGTAVRIRIRAEDVIIATEEPRGLSALNILPAVVEAVHVGHGPGAMLRLRAAEGAVLARVTRRSVASLDLRPGARVWAVLKTSGVSRVDVGIIGNRGAGT